MLSILHTPHRPSAEIAQELQALVDECERNPELLTEQIRIELEAQRLLLEQSENYEHRHEGGIHFFVLHGSPHEDLYLNITRLCRIAYERTKHLLTEEGVDQAVDEKIA